MSGDIRSDSLGGSVERTATIEADVQKVEGFYTQASLASLLKEEAAKRRAGSKLLSIETQQEALVRQAEFLEHLLEQVVAGEEDLMGEYCISTEASPAEVGDIVAVIHALGYTEQQIREYTQGIQEETVDEIFELLKKYDPRSVFHRIGGDHRNLIIRYNEIKNKAALKEEINSEEFAWLMDQGTDPGVRQGRPLAYLVSRYQDLFAGWSEEGLARGRGIRRT